MFRPGNLGHLGRLGLVAASQPSLITQALAILAKYGSAANLYLPGVGSINVITAGNWLDSAGTTAATVDGAVGTVVNARGGPNLVQATTANKPVLRRGLVNLLLQSRNYATTWNAVASSATVASNVAIAPDGTTTADALVEVSGVTYGLNQATSASGAATFAVIAKAGAKQFVYLQPNSNGAYFNLSTGVIGHVGAFCTGTSMAQIGDGWYLCVVNFASNSTPLQIYAAPAGVVNSIGYTGVAGVRAIYLSDSAVFSGTLTAQQIIDAGGIPLTTTAPASSNSGAFAWQWVDSNDSFASTLTPGNAGFFCLGARFNDGGVARSLIGAGAGSTSESGVWLARNSVNFLRLQVGNGSTLNTVSAAYPIAENAVASAGWDTSNVFVGINNTETSGAKTVNCTSSNTLNIGVLTGTTLPMLGTIGAIIIMPTVLPTVTELATLRKFIASLSGVTM